MTRVVFSNQPSAVPVVNVIQSTLIVSHAMTDDGKGFAYRFTENEIVNHDPYQILSITLDARLKGGSDAYIDSFVCTHRPQIATKTPMTDGRFPLQTKTVDFELRMKVHEFIFIGIIVGIKVGGTYKFILCDPQVGNGPPNNGTAALIL